MNIRPRRPSPRFAAVFAAVAMVWAGVLAALLWIGWPEPAATPQPSASAAPEAASAREVSAPPRPDPREPAVSLDTFLHVAATGGDRLSREAAIAWLDTLARERRAPEPAAAERVLGVLRDGGHPSWTPGYRLHLFNSAFNALRRAPSPEPLTALLHRLVVGDPDPDMRNYALQHLRSQRRAGRLEGAAAAEIRATLESLAAEPGGPLAGLAVATLLDWGGPEAASAELALATAADRGRTPDVRVTALHAAAEASLPLAREVSADPAEPTILRKAAISRLGRHGGENELAALEDLRGESGRLDQAVDPALESLRARLADPAAPQPVPYRTRPIR